MGLFDEMKDKAEELKDKASELIKGHEDQVDGAIDKAGDFVDEKTGGQYAEHVDTAQAKAKEAADGLNEA